MPNFQRVLSNRSGQTLLIAILLGIVLLIALAVVVFVNQVGTFHQSASAQRTNARAVAEEGIAFVTQELSVSSVTWQNALNGNFSGTDCNTGSDVTSPSGSNFKLYCSTGTAGNSNLQIYEVAVIAIAVSPVSANGRDVPLRAIKAYLSQRTLGVDLQTGIHAAAALQTVTSPSTSGTLNVHWGPIVCIDTNNLGAWTVPDPMDTSRYPRKFSLGGITGAAYTRSGLTSGSGPVTDQKEYWAYAPAASSPWIDDATYQALASSTVVVTAPVNGAGLPIPRASNCAPSVPNCGYFQPTGTDIAIFSGAGAGFVVTGGSSTVIYVNGPAEFDNIAVDSATFIVTGSLTVNNSATPAATVNLHVPVTAPSEYPYYPTTPASWPCSGPSAPAPGDTVGSQPAYDCPSSSVFTLPVANSGTVQFRGFLWVKGTMTVNTSNGWNMAGSLMVGDPLSPPASRGSLSVLAGCTLNVAYDDVLNHLIRVNPINGTSVKVEPDFIQDIPVPTS